MREIHDRCRTSVPAAAIVANTPPESAAMTICSRMLKAGDSEAASRAGCVGWASAALNYT